MVAGCPECKEAAAVPTSKSRRGHDAALCLGRQAELSPGIVPTSSPECLDQHLPWHKGVDRSSAEELEGGSTASSEAFLSLGWRDVSAP